jgi:sec-independent protein translocase protein TatA
MFKEIGFGEIFVIGLVFLLLFGAKKIPEMMGGVGKGIREFKKSMTDTQDAIMGPGLDDRTPGPQRMMDTETRPAPQGGEPKRLSQ